MDTEEFKRRCLPLHIRLYRTAFRLMGNTMDAEDMVQETYLKLWERRDALEHVANLESYSTSLLRNLCIDAFRKKRPEEDSPPPEDFPLADNEDAATALERQEEATQLTNLINRLPEGQRTVMTLHDVEGCSYEEIEEATGFTAVNIRVMLSRARKKIREQFERIRNYGQG
ncbi:MAG: RNA polymerase sigma factor [Bacteroidaceae bacterium]|nr:RNA polymerase sigma factor [Bacteroidaceae bacterium]